MVSRKIFFEFRDLCYANGVAMQKGVEQLMLAAVRRNSQATGRRVGAILSLQYQDLRLDQGQYGSIRWPADSDKCGKEWSAPLSDAGRKAIDAVLQQRPGIGAAYLFPAINDPSKPLAVGVAAAWLIAAEKIAGVEKQAGGLRHPYRRKWVTERKHLPDVDVAACGGWADLSTLQTCYMQPDPETMQRVVSSPVRLRETLEQ